MTSVTVVPGADLHHPFHLHGYDFYVMAIDQFRNGETLNSISRKLLETNFRRSSLPARKDTIAVPSNGYAAIRFRADNPGTTPSLTVHLTGSYIVHT
jgi:FtsP/CotA-like multicopper oxidase with cupredoxin domain